MFGRSNQFCLLPGVIARFHGGLPQGCAASASQKRWKINTIDATHDLGCDG
jgi:hypothetical protein